MNSYRTLAAAVRPPDFTASPLPLRQCFERGRGRPCEGMYLEERFVESVRSAEHGVLRTFHYSRCLICHFPHCLSCYLSPTVHLGTATIQHRGLSRRPTTTYTSWSVLLCLGEPYESASTPCECAGGPSARRVSRLKARGSGGSQPCRRSRPEHRLQGPPKHIVWTPPFLRPRRAAPRSRSAVRRGTATRNRASPIASSGDHCSSTVQMRRLGDMAEAGPAALMYAALCFVSYPTGPLLPSCPEHSAAAPETNTLPPRTKFLPAYEQEPHLHDFGMLPCLFCQSVSSPERHGRIWATALLTGSMRPP